MYEMMQVTFDCTDVPAMERFWTAAVGYERESPPPGFASWEEFAEKNQIPRSEWDSRSAAVDPGGAGPRFFFQRVPEGKSAKNRVHLDLRLSRREGSGGLEAEVERLVALGAERVEALDELGVQWVVMRDIEGNELCVS